MTWLLKLTEGIKLKAAVVIIVICIISVNILIAASAYYNYLQHKTAISDNTLTNLIMFYSSIAMAGLGFLFNKGEVKNEIK